MYKDHCIPNTKQMANLESYSVIRSNAYQMEQDTHPQSVQHSKTNSKQPHPLDTPSFTLISLKTSVVSMCLHVAMTSKTLHSCSVHAKKDE
jgi:hypothetical protein